MEMFAEFMKAEIGQPAAFGTYRYLLVDASATHPLNVARILGLEGRSTDLLTAERCNWPNCASPVLIEVPDVACPEASAASARFFETWRYANCFTFIESSHPWGTTLDALRARTAAVLPDDVPVLLRFYDARIFPRVLEVLDAEQRQRFLGIARRWVVPGRQGELHAIESEETPQDRHPSPLPLTRDQEAALIDASDVDAMVDLLLNQNHPSLTAALPPEQHDRVEAALTSAKSLAIGNGSDQIAYCALYLELGPGFMEQEPWRNWLHDIKTGKLTFSDAMNLAMETT